MDNESFIEPNQCKIFSFFADSPGFANQHPLMTVSYQSAVSSFHLCHHTQGSVMESGFPSTISSCCGILPSLSPQYLSPGLRLILPPPLPAGGDLLLEMLYLGVCKKASFPFFPHRVPAAHWRSGTAPLLSLLPDHVRIWVFSPTQCAAKS